jgi:hypothetical protein
MEMIVDGKKTMEYKAWRKIFDKWLKERNCKECKGNKKNCDIISCLEDFEKTQESEGQHGE